jgi:type II secretory pathway pseudopilin PulG
MAMRNRPLASLIPVRRFARAAARRLAAEQGFAVPTVLLMIVAALGMAGIAVSASIQGQSGTVRDQQSKSALAVAESGASQALLHYNRYGIVPELNPCEPIGSTGPDGNGWCAPVTGSAVNGGTTTYYVKPDPAGGELEIVSVGIFGGVTRRINIAASSSSGQRMFVDADVKSEDGITLDSNSEIHSGSATNGNITLASNAKHCGQASVGIGKELTGSGYYSDIKCTTSGSVLEDEISLPPVNQGTAAEINDNGLLFEKDLISGKKGDACWNGFDGDGKKSKSCGARELLVDNNSSVTLGGEVYSFCKLTLKSNSSLYIAQGKYVTIYFDSPEACNYPSGTTQLELLSNSRITAAVGKAVNVALLFVGSTARATNIVLNSNTAVDGPCEQNFVIYGPYTDIELDSNTKFCGAMAGKSIHLDSNAEIWTSSGTDSWVVPNTAPHFVVNRFVDCSTSTAVVPDEGC